MIYLLFLLLSLFLIAVDHRGDAAKVKASLSH